MLQRIIRLSQKNHIRLTKAVVIAVKAKATDDTTDEQLLQLIKDATS